MWLKLEISKIKLVSLIEQLNSWQLSNVRKNGKGLHDKKNRDAFIFSPFSANGARTSKIISLLSCSICFLKSFTNSSATFVLANCSLLDSKKKKKKKLG